MRKGLSIEANGQDKVEAGGDVLEEADGRQT